MSSDQAKTHVRWLIRRDLPEACEVERLCFEYPWSEEDFLRCLRQRNCISMVAEQDGKVIGFMAYELLKVRIHILNIAVHPGRRRKGVGTKMIEYLFKKLSSDRRPYITVEVRETNLAAQLFFRKIEFRAVRVLRNYYEDSGEDAIFMLYDCRKDDVRPTAQI